MERVGRRGGELLRKLGWETRLAVVFGFVLVLIVSVQVFFVIPSARTRHIAAAYAKQQATVQAVSQQLEMMLRIGEENLTQLASLWPVETLNADMLPVLLSDSADASAIFEKLYVIDAQAEYVAASSTPIDTHKRETISERAFFTVPFYSGDTYVGTPIYHANKGLLAASMSVPIRNSEGDITGVLMGSLVLNNFVDAVQSSPLTQEQTLYLVNADGLLILQSNLDLPSLAGASYLTDYRTRLLVSAALHGEDGTPRQYTENGVAMIGCFSRLALGGWSVLIEAPADVALASSNASSRALLILNLGLFLVSTVLIVFATGRVHQDRMRVQGALDSSEGQYHATLDAMADLIHVIDRGYRLVVINKALAAYGKQRNFDAQVFDPDSHTLCPLLSPSTYKEYEQVFASGQPLVTEDVRSYSDHKIVVETRKIPVLENGRVVRVVTAMRDITQSRQNEERLERRGETAEALQAISAVASHSLYLAEVREAIREQLAAWLGVPAGALFSFDPTADLFTLEASWGISNECSAALSHTQASARPELPALSAGELVLGSNAAQLFGSAACSTSLAGLTSSLWVPLPAEGRLWGALLLCDHKPLLEDEGQKPLFQVLGQSLGAAIRHAQLYQDLQEKNERVMSLAQREMHVRQAERESLARELHDEVAQMLTSLLARLHFLRQAEDMPRRLVMEVDTAEMAAENTMAVLHRLCEDLRPIGLKNAGLAVALRSYLARFGQEHGFATNFDAGGLEGVRYDPSIEISVYRVVQEALTNAARHAQATCVDVTLTQRDGKVLAVIEDDGTGFDPNSVEAGEHLGLVGMRERAELLGGTLTIESSSGQGTSIYLEVPNDRTRADRG